MRLKILSLYLAAIFCMTAPGFSGCGSEAGNPDGDEDEPRKYHDPDGTLAFSLSEVVITGEKVMTSAMATQGDTLGGGGLALDQATVGSTPRCTSYGMPINADAARNTQGDAVKHMSPTDPDFAAGYFYCLLAQDTNSSESVPGAFVRANIFPCVAGHIRFDGVEKIVTMNVDDSALLACAGAHRVDGLKDQGVTELTTTYTATVISTGGWEGEIVFANKAGTQPVSSEKVRVTRTEAREVMAHLTTDSDGLTEAFVYDYDIAVGRVFYERWAPNAVPGDNSTASTHARLLLKGELADAAFSSLTSYEGMHAEVRDPGDTGEARFMTISGGAGGFRTKHLNCFNAGDACDDYRQLPDWVTVHAADNCYGGTGCTTAIAIDAASFPFLLDEAVAPGVLTPEAWFNQLTTLGDGYVFSEGRL